MKNLVATLLVVLVVCVLIGIVQYNRLVNRDEALSRAWTPMLGALQKRYDGIPRLVNEIIMYTATEDADVKALAESYKAFSAAQGMDNQVSTANDLEMKLDDTLLEAATRYPGIEGHYQFQALKRNFIQDEQEITPAAAAYNQAAEEFNQFVRRFPNDIVASIVGMKHENFYFKKLTPVEPKPGDTP